MTIRRAFACTVFIISLTLLSVIIYTSVVDVTSMAQAMSIMTDMGHIEIVGKTLVFSHSEQSLGYSTDLLQAIEKVSTHYTVYIQ